MNFTLEQLEILVKGFQEHDFTQLVHLPAMTEESELSKEQAKKYKTFYGQVQGYMRRNLPELGFKRNMNNFTREHPVNLLMHADADHIAEKALEIFDDEEQKDAAIEQYMELFYPLIETAAESYCEAKGKTIDDLSDADMRKIFDRVTNTVNEELMNAVMQGQQFPAINDIAHRNLAHEDFGSKFNFDSINFYVQWTKCKQYVGTLLSIEAENEKAMEEDPDGPLPIDPGYNVDYIYQVMKNSFCETLDDIDITIFHMREDGCTQGQIAEKLGYKNHSAVTKRLKSMRKRWDEFMSEIEPKQ